MSDEKRYTHAEIKALLAAITPGEWIVTEFAGAYVVTTVERDVLETPFISKNGINNAQFAAAAPTIVKQLLDEREVIRDKVEWILSYAYKEQEKNTLPRTADYDRMQSIIDYCNEILKAGSQ